MTFKHSKHRDMILTVLAPKNFHPSVDEIFSIIKTDFPKISLATVYRNIEQLTRIGKIVKIEIGSGSARYDGNVEKHFHIKCNKCGKISDVWLNENIGDHINLKNLIEDFTITGYRIDFFGICKNCNQSH